MDKYFMKKMEMISIFRTLVFVYIASFLYANTLIIGGFSAPIYIKNYNEKELDSILKNNTIKSILITYPNKQTNLAKRIARYIKINNSKIHIKLDELNLSDTDTVKYQHDVVTVVLFFK